MRRLVQVVFITSSIVLVPVPNPLFLRNNPKFSILWTNRIFCYYLIKWLNNNQREYSSQLNSDFICVLHNRSPRVYYTAWLTGCGKYALADVLRLAYPLAGDRLYECYQIKSTGTLFIYLLYSSSTLNYILGFLFLCLVHTIERLNLALRTIPVNTLWKSYEGVATIKPNNGLLNKWFDICFFFGLLCFFPYLWFSSCLFRLFLCLFLLAVPMHERLGEYFCMSSPFSEAILSNTCFLLSCVLFCFGWGVLLNW